MKKASIWMGVVLMLVLSSSVVLGDELFLSYISLPWNDANGEVSEAIPYFSDQGGPLSINFGESNIRCNSDGTVRGTLSTSVVRYWDVIEEDDIYWLPEINEASAQKSYYKLEWLATPTEGEALFDMQVLEQ